MSAQVLKREVLVSSRHPALYLVYWSFVWNRDCSYPDIMATNC
ncbi:hypothetical protein ALP33_200178 [Pseudomonas amygdali pv. lachrymans]|uniref:Uncharacterized protein n=1 Tax=Pseudomonas amygdali pv. lachrymans TaxID=53707 RepID=A0AB37RC71_PSEAV|nr:hypothetical protein BV327_04321 [Pseudomonas syringae pv. actinidiae]RML77438.1 hypothetical protein ALQ90_200117 [Pseudomonas savastanoi pv. savastanoi]RMT92099.1 hypothetical protein ALP37_200072 [Pseudomonas amygdali pv. sesami]RMU21938.1 hypothetical protein ALP33_200178 [Pseudomonas amygdali pv. lachrymans]RMV56694.1 hypothetical protein ALP07_01641 [Pseudomonas savastanoi pv. glycinea]